MKLTRDLVVFDIETTGTWIEKDKIVEIAMIKTHPNGMTEIYHKKVNPEMNIPDIISELIGITNEDVKDAPLFKDIAMEILEFIDNCDFGGFNIERFDLPLLAREMRESGNKFNWKVCKVYDVQKVYHLNEKRDLTAAYKFYCNKNHDNAHSALSDTEATLEILSAQVSQYGKDDQLESLGSFEYKVIADFYDDERKFRWWNGKLYMMFGKYAKKGSLQEVVSKDPKYLEWIVSAKFSEEIKVLVQDALIGKFPVQNSSK